MKIIFTKAKSTRQLLFSENYSSVIKNEDQIKINCVLFLTFSGKYKIISIEKDNFICTVYKTVKVLDFDIDWISKEDTWMIYIAKTNKKLMLYNSNNEGIILKS
jgi:hypothetical protein